MPGSLLEFDQARLAESFAKAPMAVSHRLSGHPLFGLERIGKLADGLSGDSVEHNVGDVPEVLPDGEAPQLDLSPGEIARGIESNGCWMVLKRVEADPEYRELLERCLGEVTPHVAEAEGGVTRMEAYIFLSAPNSKTPAHIDPEHNLLLQIRGTKEMDVGGFPDPGAEGAELERYYGGGHRNLSGIPSKARTFPLAPGDGVYVPVHAPHLVRSGPEPSISFSITFYTVATERAASVHSVNAKLRRLGLSPSPPGRRPGTDRVKAGAWAGLRRGKRLVARRGSRPAS